MKRLFTGIFVYCYVCSTIYAATQAPGTGPSSAASGVKLSTASTVATQPSVASVVTSSSAAAPDASSSTASTTALDPNASTTAPGSSSSTLNSNNPGSSSSSIAPANTVTTTTPKPKKCTEGTYICFLQPKKCTEGTCTGHITCLAGVQGTCILTGTQSCVQNKTTTSTNGVTSIAYTFGCKDSCEPLTQTATPSPNSTITTVTKCCTEDLCSNIEIPDPKNNLAKTLRAYVVMCAFGIVATFVM